MADLGTLTTIADYTDSFQQSVTVPHFPDTTSFVRYVPSWQSDPLNRDVLGTIAGKVMEGLTPIPNSPVYLIWRNPFQVIAVTRTNAQGEYSFTGLDRNASDYLAIATREEQFNAIVWDRLTPI